LIYASSSRGRGAVLFGSINMVSYHNKRMCIPLVSNFSHHITMNFYISKIPFQRYKERTKQTLESKVMVILQKIIFYVSEELMRNPLIFFGGINTNSYEFPSEGLMEIPLICIIGLNINSSNLHRRS
jgi:hypothetical protein